MRFDTGGGTSVWFLSAEALCVFKLLFFRTKDVVDLERLIAVHGAALDAGYVRAHIVAMLGGDDTRVVTWDRLATGLFPLVSTLIDGMLLLGQPRNAA